MAHMIGDVKSSRQNYVVNYKSTELKLTQALRFRSFQDIFFWSQTSPDLFICYVFIHLSMYFVSFPSPLQWDLLWKFLPCVRSLPRHNKRFHWPDSYYWYIVSNCWHAFYWSAGKPRKDDWKLNKLLKVKQITRNWVWFKVSYSLI